MTMKLYDMGLGILIVFLIGATFGAVLEDEKDVIKKPVEQEEQA